jgi:transcriptional antiterminator NusG
MTNATKFYAINVLSGKEKQIKEQILFELKNNKMDNYVIDIIIPKEKYYQLRQGKKIKSEKNFLPGYIMIETTSMNGEIIRLINKINGVIGFLGENKEKPIPMRENEVKRIKDIMDDDISEITFEKKYLIGEKVKIIDGAFSSFTGEIESINIPLKRINVIVMIFGRKTPIELSEIQIQKI